MSGKISRLGSSSSAHVSSAEPIRARILLVDDLPANLLALKAILEPLEQELVLAHSGDEALLALLQGDFACILMDVQMPGLTGLETASLIRERERTRHIPLLFITALSREAAYITRGYQQGAVDYLLKPVDPDILRSKVQVFVDLHVRGEQLKRQALEIAEHRRAQEEFLRAAELEQQLVGIVGQIADLLLDFTRARLGGGIPVSRRPGDLNELCRRIADEFQAAHPRRLLLSELSRNALQGEWDLERVAQVLANLLDNAFKYSPENTPVRLSTQDKDTESVLIDVHNLGAPIPGHLLPLLFEPFRRGGATDETARTSMGLGLYIAHEIVQSHGGSISVHSTAEAGTTFRVCLSRSPRHAGQASPCHEEHEASLSEAG
ncbi:MAG TPA: ATP-binding protein [Archangium sp.]|uniref:hybrid sensor histidine kinase/response regulator n=1 Tax=Archangium sp. TaxID=1872627 RepID=UPI002E354E32|nr:ATP-binding protein [Archangium sp.]HEX5751701.1 ATP-binding protein [Archangium sp.]